MKAMTMKLTHVTKRYGSTTALEDVTLTIPDNQLTVLFGPSGSGKTTIVRLLAGLETPDTGQVEKPDSFGIAAQNAPCLLHATTLENILYGLDARTCSRESRLLQGLDAASLCGCTPFLHQKAGTLSGGQKQRMILARAIITQPDVLLLDEIFANLDSQAIEQLVTMLKTQCSTILLVTHESQLAAQADTIIHIHHGQIVPQKNPDKPDQ